MIHGDFQSFSIMDLCQRWFIYWPWFVSCSAPSYYSKQCWIITNWIIRIQLSENWITFKCIWKCLQNDSHFVQVTMCQYDKKTHTWRRIYVSIFISAEGLSKEELKQPLRPHLVLHRDTTVGATYIQTRAQTRLQRIIQKMISCTSIFHKGSPNPF